MQKASYTQYFFIIFTATKIATDLLCFLAYTRGFFLNLSLYFQESQMTNCVGFYLTQNKPLLNLMANF